MALSLEEQVRQAMAQTGIINSGAITNGPAAAAKSAHENKYKTQLHWMEQQALELWGYTYVPAEGVRWQNIYKEDGSVVAVRSNNDRFSESLSGASWRFKRGREVTFSYSDEEVMDNGRREAQPRGRQPFPLWLQREKEYLARYVLLRPWWWRLWRRKK